MEYTADDLTHNEVSITKNDSLNIDMSSLKEIQIVLFFFIKNASQTFSLYIVS